jgi:hypothetical protein
MNKYLLTITLLLSSLLVNAQEVISTQGDSYSNRSGSIDFTIGEVIINTVINESNDITQGFHQINWDFLEIEDHHLDYEATIFPNPTEDILNIKTTTFENVTYTLYDAQGKLVLHDKLSAEQTSVKVSQLAAGYYSLILTNGTEELKTFKLVKRH